MNKFPECRTPGQLIKKLLEARGWNQRVLAVVLGVEESVVNKTVTDKRKVDGEMALLLGEVFGESFGVEPEDFLDLQKSYELAMARVVTQPDPGRGLRATLFGDLPVSDMIKRGWIRAESVRDTANVEASLLKFFRVDSLNDIEVLPHAAKKTNVVDGVTPRQLAWFYRLREIADDMITPPYSPKLLKEALKQLQLLTKSPEEIRKVPRILTEAGVRFVVSENFPSGKIDGVCFWLSDEKPVIGMTLRFDRIDNFWFVLRHEIEHVLREHGKQARTVFLDSDLSGEKVSGVISEEERVANEAAAEFCVPRKHLDAFIERKAPFFSERDLIGFANAISVHPGIVAGLLQRETNRYDLFRDYLVKVRHHITPTAVVDGWGDVYPIEE